MMLEHYARQYGSTVEYFERNGVPMRRVWFFDREGDKDMIEEENTDA